MRPLLFFFPALVVAACSTTPPPTTCPTGAPPTCFGSATDTCYCTPVSTCAYCAALFHARPADPDPQCAPYRAQGSSCHSSADCASAAGAPAVSSLVCHAGNDAYASQCIFPCASDVECPAGEVCLTGATASGGVCDRACTATTLFLDGGVDAASFGDSGLDASALTSLENACVSYYAERATPGPCAACVQSQAQECAAVDAGACDPSLTLEGCEIRCKVTSAATTTDCACLAACLAPCAAQGGAFYSCVTGACGDSCL